MRFHRPAEFSDPQDFLRPAKISDPRVTVAPFQGILRSGNPAGPSGFPDPQDSL